MIIAAFFLAARSSNQDDAARSRSAVALQTALHAAPTARPTETPTRVPPPTPFRLTHTDPTTPEVIDLLFQYPYRSAFRIASRSVRIVSLDDGRAEPTLVVAGDHGFVTDELVRIPFAFGAILVWQDGEYKVKFKHQDSGYRDASVSATVNDSRRVVFIFHSLGRLGALDQQIDTAIVVRPCSGASGDGPLEGLAGRPASVEFACY